MSKIEKYIEKKLDLSGGACISQNAFNLYHIDFCARENGFKILKINIILFFKWIFGGWKDGR